MTFPRFLTQFELEKLRVINPKGDTEMKPSRFKEEQIIRILKENESGTTARELCRRHGISPSTFFNWRSKYGGMDVSDARRLKQLEDENRKLKRIVADQALDIVILKDVNSKKW